MTKDKTVTPLREQFLRNSHNKDELIKFVVQDLKTERHEAI